jgi:uncharacterized repeat protein (TIGR03803 family)
MILCVLLFCFAAVITTPAQSVYFTTLVNFAGADGAVPLAALIEGTDGNFYGTTSAGGAYSSGTVFKMTSAGTLTTLYSFCSLPNCTDGSGPAGGLVQASDGNFYGTTLGTVFRITPEGALTTIYTFCSQPGCADGYDPEAALVQATDGNFYGTTNQGGTTGGGTAFKITPEGALTTLYSFCASGQYPCPDGLDPYGGLVQGTDGDFYGTTEWGGLNWVGSVFKITLSGTLTTLHNFGQGGDGARPFAGLIQASDGNFYGTTVAGGGTVFKITSSGALTTIYTFCSLPNCADGGGPFTALVQATDGNFYGTTYGGGQYQDCYGDDCGTVFRVTPSGTLTTLHSFDNSDGAAPWAGLAQGRDGSFYGATSAAGANGDGTIFRVGVVRTCATCRP